MNDKIMLSIKPEYADAILNGTKQFEFRTKKPISDIKHIIIYETAPIKAVVGEADVDYVLVDSPSHTWWNCKTTAGITKKDFFEYYQGKTTAVAYHLVNVKRYDKPRSLSDYGVSYPPQSFLYINDSNINI